MRKAKAYRYIQSLTEDDKAALKEPGCVAYDIFESSTRPDVLMICETWKDADALSIHEQTAHFVSYVGKMKELSEMKLEKFNF